MRAQAIYSGVCHDREAQRSVENAAAEGCRADDAMPLGTRFPTGRYALLNSATSSRVQLVAPLVASKHVHHELTHHI